MLPKEHRLKAESDIKRLFSKGKGVHHTLVGAKIRKNTLDVSRFVFIVGTKVHKRAYRRNKLRRRLRAIVRIHLPHIADGYDIAIIAKPDALVADVSQLEESTLTALKKASVLKPPLRL